MINFPADKISQIFPWSLLELFYGWTNTKILLGLKYVQALLKSTKYAVFLVKPF